MKKILPIMFLCMMSQCAFADDCGEIPYSIGFKSGTGQLSVTVPEEVKARLGQLTASAGGTVVRSGFAAASQIAFSEVLRYYECAINKYVESNTAIQQPAKQKIATDLKSATTNLRIKAAMYFSAFAQSNGELITTYSNELETKIRTADGPTVDLSIVKAAIGSIDVLKTFQVSTAKSLWANVDIRGVSATACGNYIKSALVANAGIIQGVASNTRAVLYDYLDGTSPQMVQASLAQLFVLASASGGAVVPGGADATTLLNNCARDAKAAL